MKRLGSRELRMPELRAPRFLQDLFWDLWDRGLMPLVALIVVATAAAPFLLGGSHEAPPPLPSPGAAAAGIAPQAANSSALTVVQARPGLRDYRKRLARLSPTNPFKQRYTAPLLKGAKLNPMTTETSSGSTTVTTGGKPESESGSTGSPPGGSAGGAPPSGGGAPPSGEKETSIHLFAFAINVKITRVDTKKSDSTNGKPESTIKLRVLPLTALPGEKAPVVTYMGISKKKKPLLLVSTDVQSVFGEGKCLEGDEVCQLLEVEPGFPVVFVYGANEVHYTINVFKIEPIPVGTF